VARRRDYKAEYQRRKELAAQRSLASRRPVILEGGDGVELVIVREPRAADAASHAFRVQWAFIHGDASEGEVRQLAGVTVEGRPVEADPDRLEAIATRGGFDVDEVYRELAS
jgi:hypothetical protein